MSTLSQPSPRRETLPHALGEGIPDRIDFSEGGSAIRRGVLLALAAGGGVALGVTAEATGSTAFTASMLGGLAFAGGLLSTWSPCGYSSLCLLRPIGRWSAQTILRWMPTFAAHGLGYAAGALILGAVLGGAGALLGFDGLTGGILVALALGALLYGAHQFGFVRVPYPQRRAQVPHDARQRFSMPFIGGLYGIALGLNYLTYVQTPILYLVTAAALLSGDVASAIGLFALFNLGRFLPIAVNLLPVTDVQVQTWLANRQEAAATLDGALLTAAGMALLVTVVL
ncbi:methylamine utilization protein MauF [Chthonobacter rhizosphaerae]|uniref:methylamine utilization protein MauF n=1 Tax=Chthonobacter rhizosphaerae TaxID=2735553 RepID=UPI0015EFCEF8|nr:methylamine utilization protein MauF [Chthonobacter rhizosphaerae]